MVRLVDVPIDNGDPNRAITDLNEGITQSRETPAPEVRANPEPDLDPRFAGKSTKELAEMYKHLESHSGRLANTIGQYKSQLEQLTHSKRENDLRQNGGDIPRAEIKPTDLLTNPTEALDRYHDSRIKQENDELRQRLAQVESSLNRTLFTVNHKDADSVTADPAFQRWVQQTPLRMQLAQNAANNDWSAADLLMREYLVSKGAGTEPITTAQDRAQELAKKVSLEGGSSGTEGASSRRTGKIYRSADLQALRAFNPDKYEDPAFQNEILRAYAEGRVK